VLGESSVTVPVGLSNFRQTLLQVKAPQGTTPGAFNFTVTATSQSNSQISGSATGTLNVAAQGVSLSLSPPTVNPGGTFQLTVHNLGQVSDTFTLALGGPAAAISQISTNTVTLAAGQSQNLPITVGAAPFAAQGALGLVVTATGGVTGSTSGTVTIPATKSVSAAFNPMRTGVSGPGPVTLLLQVGNTGTVDDTYVATIVSTSGPLQAQIIDITGQPVTTTSVFAIPGSGIAQLAVHANLTGMTDGTVTVKITSQSDPGVTVNAVGVVGIGNDTPVAVAGKKRNVRTGKYTSLDGGLSYDPDGARLTYSWTIVSKPAGSGLFTLGGAATPQPYFLPDVDGVYTLQLVVNNGTTSSLPSTVQITAVTGSVPPNADAGRPENARRGTAIVLNGSGSSDPNQSGTPLTYHWTVQLAPAGSTLAGAVVGSTASPTFTPDVDGAFTLALQVSDSAGTSTDTVIITALDPNVTPNAVAGTNRRILPNTLITVDGSGSFDPDNGPGPLSYEWRFVSAPISDASLVNAGTAHVGFTPGAPGFYVLRLDVSDGTAGSFDETTVMAANFCDANADGTVNQADFDLMSALFGTAAQPGDPLDVNGDGMITAADLQLCQGQSFQPSLPSLYAVPKALAFQYVKSGPLPAPQVMGIFSDIPTYFTLAADSPWIQLSAQSGTTTNLSVGIQVSINPAGLAPGPYVGNIYAFAQGFNSPAPVRIELTVYDAPKFIVIPSSLSFTAQAGQPPPPPQTLSVGASGANVSFTVSVSGGTWLSASPSVGGTPQAITVTASPLGLDPGTYTGAVSLSAPLAGTQSVPVTLTVQPPPPSLSPSGIVNAASLTSGSLAPGEYVLLNGGGFATGGQLLAPASGPIPTKLGTTQVFFGSIAAPLLSVRPNQIEAIVPFEVTGSADAPVTVVYAGVSSPEVDMPVAASTVGVFTADGSGAGQISALNGDSTANSASNPAARGSVVTMYLTGAGQTDPGGIDGQIAPPGPAPAQKISVTIGGQPATVTYSAGAPTFAAGLIQLNVQIPQSVSPGVAVGVQVTVGASNSQPGITLAVR